MIETEHLLVCLAEECSEVQKVVCKALRFGLDDRDPHGMGATNRTELERELSDLITVAKMLSDKIGIKPYQSEAKRHKVIDYMRYAATKGVLILDKCQVL